MISSHDAGETWTPGTRVTDRSVDAQEGVTFANYDLIGPIGIAATEHSTLFAWGDTRAGDPPAEAEDTYFTQVRHANPSTDEPAVEAGNGLLWGGVGGAGVTLIVAGLILLLVMRSTRHKASTPSAD